jgi:hypothetical protein
LPDSDPAANEYTQLREEKGADWRLITQTALTTLATTAAIAVGALAAHSRILVVLAPIPLYIGVLYLIESVWLQNRINTFIASRAPHEALNYEGWVLATRRPETTAPKAPRWAESSWWWTFVACAMGLMFSAVPFFISWEDLDGFETACPGKIAAVGAGFLLAFVTVAVYMIWKSNRDRGEWEAYWTTGDGAARD